jgi:hypothetical protein
LPNFSHPSPNFTALHSVSGTHKLIRFPLFAWKEFHDLKDTLNEMKLGRIVIVADSSFEALMEKDQ